MDMNKMLCFMDNFILFSFSVCCSSVLKQKSLPTYDVVVITQYASRQSITYALFFPSNSFTSSTVSFVA